MLCQAGTKNSRGWTLQRGDCSNGYYRPWLGCLRSSQAMQCCLAACCSNSFRILYTCFILLYCWFFLNYSWWIALNRRHEKTTSDVRRIVSYKQLTEMWVSSIGVDQAFPLDCLNLLHFFGCRLPQPSKTLFLTDSYWKAAVWIWNGQTPKGTLYP